jgi:aspartate/methionine/tyrosine aminotransferase
MEWAKLCSQARFNLATSGLVDYPLAELPVRLEELELTGPSFYGYQPLQQLLAAKCAVPEGSVVAAIGTSMANHLAMAAVLNPGDQVLIERPTYEPLLAAARYLGAEIRRFDRHFSSDFRVDPQEIARHLSQKTRLIVITNLHNPSGALTDEKTMKQVGEMARSAGAKVLVDEVYLETLYAKAPRSAFHLGEQFLVTGSLTKAYGLGGLRCGWILAEPELARRLWRLNDLFGVIPAHVAERLSVIALQNLDRMAARSRAILEANRTVFDGFLESCESLELFRPQHGTIVFPRLRQGDANRFCALLREKYETAVVPGSFFEMPNHFRLGLGGPTEMVAAGLARLADALRDFSS